jgi:hypothetical protein
MTRFLLALAVASLGGLLVGALMARVELWESDAEVERERAIVRRMDEAAVDDHRCDCCHEVAAVRELIPLYDDAVMCCAGCADVLKGRVNA